LYPFKEIEGVSTYELVSDEYHTIEWEEQFPKVVLKDIEAILDNKVVRKTSGKVYYQYLVKWNN